MTTFVNDLEGGVDGQPVNTGSIATSGYGYHVTTTGTAVFTASNAINGNMAMQQVRSSNNVWVNTNATLSTDTVSASHMFAYLSAMPNNNDYIFDIRQLISGVNTSAVRCLINNTGHPFVQIFGAVVWTATQALGPAGTQYRVDYRSTRNASSGTIYVDFYSPTGTSPLITGCALTAKNTGSSPYIDVNMGAFGNNSVTGCTLVLDCFRLDDSQASTYWGPPTVGTIAIQVKRTGAWSPAVGHVRRSGAWVTV